MRLSSRRMSDRSGQGRSILLRNKKVGIPRLLRSFHKVLVWLCTPAGALTTKMAQSSTESVRSISAEKSTCPGVSRSVAWMSPASSTACLEKMVIPRWRSRAKVSRKASP